jgi:hypothetical protein
MEYAGEMSPGAMIYIPSFIRIGLNNQRSIRKFIRTHRQHGDLVSLNLFIYFFKIKIVGGRGGDVEEGEEEEEEGGGGGGEE